MESDIMTEEYGSLCIENLIYVSNIILYHPHLSISTKSITVYFNNYLAN